MGIIPRSAVDPPLCPSPSLPFPPPFPPCVALALHRSVLFPPRDGGGCLFLIAPGPRATPWPLSSCRLLPLLLPLLLSSSHGAGPCLLNLGLLPFSPQMPACWGLGAPPSLPCPSLPFPCCWWLADTTRPSLSPGLCGMGPTEVCMRQKDPLTKETLLPKASQCLHVVSCGPCALFLHALFGPVLACCLL